MTYFRAIDLVDSMIQASCSLVKNNMAPVLKESEAHSLPFGARGGDGEAHEG